MSVATARAQILSDLKLWGRCVVSARKGRPLHAAALELQGEGLVKVQTFEIVYDRRLNPAPRLIRLTLLPADGVELSDA